ncbi:preprotein translocase subunit SecE [Candidatus Gracilibacteria bacterium]|nr:preprotein translocase subunit SecE [Candidatus Gracilibacteria bacterium]
MDNIIKYLKETLAELKEVVFPTTSQTINYTIIVVIISVIVAAALGGIDFGLRTGLSNFLNR